LGLKMKRITIITMSALACSVVAVMLFPSIRSSLLPWPEIENRSLLLAEAAALCQTPALGKIPTEDWPPSIAALNPQEVLAHEHQISVKISRGGFLSPAWGYDVLPPDPITGKSVWEIHTIGGKPFTNEQRRIYRWESNDWNW
jgi:hypothetical protein